MSENRPHAQPCDNFIDSPLDHNAHQCPHCGGIRRFCDNCCHDHHDGGWEACYLRQIAKLRNTIEAMERALTDHQPKTADGVPVTQGMAVFEPVTGEVGCYFASAFFGDGTNRSIHQCYSTQSAAIAAAKPDYA